MILSHTGSIGQGSKFFDFADATFSANKSLPEIKEMMVPGGRWFTLDLYLNKKPGTYFTYGNINFGIIGTLIEALSGVRFDIYMRDQVLKPLGI